MKEACDPALHENWSEALVMQKTTVLYQVNLLQFHSKKLPEWTVLLENVIRTFHFSAIEEKKNKQKEKPPRNVRLTADTREEIRDIISYTTVNLTSAWRLRSLYANCFRVEFPNSFSRTLEKQKISKV